MPLENEKPAFQTPIKVNVHDYGYLLITDRDSKLILSTRDGMLEELNSLIRYVNQGAAAKLFMAELLDSVETLTGIAEEYGARTLSDLMYLQLAILKGTSIESYENESAVGELVSALPSHERWIAYIDRIPAPQVS